MAKSVRSTVSAAKSQSASVAVVPLAEAARKVRIVNLGCSKNQVDSESILGEFGRAGFTLAGEEDKSQVTVINTCGFIEAAKEESIQEILSALEGRNKGEKLVVAGCLSQRYRDELFKDIPEVDLYVGTYKAGEIVERLGLTSTLPSDCKVGSAPRQLMGEEAHHAYLKIAEGCNRVCGFCAIPGMRGKQRSRTMADVIREAQELEGWGVKEVTLIAQDLTFYGREKGAAGNLEELLRTLIKETGIPWFRLMYAYPAFVTDGLLDVIANEKRVCKYLDMPVQHASDRMLKAMRRNYSADDLRSIIKRLRTIPEMSLRTTVLLGYPGEQEDDVKTLLDFVEETRFRHLGGFTYSDEDGTHGFGLGEKVPLATMEERLGQILTLQQEIAFEENERQIGRDVQVIVDRVAEGADHHFEGRTQGDAIEVDSRVLIHGAQDVEIGGFRQVRITDVAEYDLEAVLLP
jgi:ribosomal protein S12 methylthiotransferase